MFPPQQCGPAFVSHNTWVTFSVIVNLLALVWDSASFANTCRQLHWNAIKTWVDSPGYPQSMAVDSAHVLQSYAIHLFIVLYTLIGNNRVFCALFDLIVTIFLINVSNKYLLFQIYG